MTTTRQLSVKETTMDLTRIRKNIDDLDSMIITLLAKRADLVSAAGQLKKNEQGVRDPKRVEQVIEKVRGRAEAAGLDPAIAEEIYRTMIGCFMRKELKEFGERERQTKEGNPPADIVIRKVTDWDCDQIVSIFNYYVEHGFAAYPEKPQDRKFFDFIKTIIYGDAFFALETREKKIIGFGLLKKYHPYPAFNRTAEAGYFILPEYTGRGLGGLLLEVLEREARVMEVDNLLVNISSLNPPSLAFHKKHGFRECGRFEKILIKFGRDMDIVWMQKMLR